MSIVVSCSCGKEFRARDDLAGRRLRCPACGGALVIPQPHDEPPAETFEDMIGTYAVAEEPPPPRTAPVRRVAPGPARFPLPATPVMAAHALPARGNNRPLREWLYLVLAITLLPLIWATFFSGNDEKFGDRLRDQVRAHPEQKDRILQVIDEGKITRNAILDALPGHRFDGALLARDSKTHWLFALLAAAVFFGLALLMLPATTTRPVQVFLVGLFTGTAGVFLLLALQFIASFTRGTIMTGGSILVIFFYVLKFIGFSYDAALNPNTNFFLSCFGFTFGVGLCEELCKALPLLWHYRTKSLLDWRGACLWGFLSGVGFGVSEGITYAGDYYNGVHGAGIYLVRFISCVGLHGIWAAAAGIFIYKHQNFIQDADSWYQILFNSMVLVSVPMVLHGLYDTMLKKDMDGAALAVAMISFGWLVFQVERVRREEPRRLSMGYA
jgi:RsiW-degrading membrane proteinase PrsW (M82 family)